VIEEGAVPEPELQDVLPAHGLEVEGRHPFHELRPRVGGASREPIPRLSEGVRGIQIVVFHRAMSNTCCYPVATSGSIRV
jgi:hypothetical protein